MTERIANPPVASPRPPAPTASFSERALSRLGGHYIVTMVLATRVFGSVGGFLVLYYVNLTTELPPVMRGHFDVLGAAMVVLAVALTVPLALWETRALRRVLWRLRRGEPVERELGRRAGGEAVLFASRFQLDQAVLVPLLSVLPMCLYLRIVFEAPAYILVQVTIATFLAIASVLLITFFASERGMIPVTRRLLAQGIDVPFDELPASRLKRRMNVCFSLAIVVTVLMIGALANQRAKDIIRKPDSQEKTVANLQEHIVFISVAAVAIGFALSSVLAQSVASRVGNLVEAMKRVQQGQFDERVQPTGNDEIDVLARQFNAMVEQLWQNDHTIRDLNVNLESKVKRRTRQVSKSRRTLKRSLAKLQEHDRLKTEFFSNISHELRTPLTMILTPVERLLEKHAAALPSGAVSMLDMVRLNGNRLLELINKLLDFSKLEAGRMKLKLGRLDVNGLVGELVAAATPLAEQRGIQLRFAADPTLPVFAADKDKIDVIVSNLLSNAIKFTPAGGGISLETLRADDRVWVTVSDSGIGIDESDYDRIFERFVQVDGSSSREFSGSGLGLSLAKELIELHGGQIYVQSQMGQGTRFWFDLPLTATFDVEGGSTDVASPSRRARFADLDSCRLEAPAPEEPPAPRAGAGEGLATVLVVDDSAEMRALLGEILRDDYRVLFARDGAEGMELALRALPDLIFSDVMMPQVDGQEFCRRIRAEPRTARTAFVLLTARAELAMKIDGLNCGADDYLTKPFEEKELKARARSLLKLRKLHQDLDKRNRELEAAYQELTAMQGQLLQSEKMSSLGQLVAGLAHEINNSINAVYNGIKPLEISTRRLQGLLSGPDVRCEGTTRAEVDQLFTRVFSLAGAIESGAGRTARIVADLKTFSHPGNEDFDDFDLREALDLCLNLLFSQVKHRVLLQRDYGDVGTVHGPYGNLNQVFMNILNNAQQAIEGEGEITITTRQRDEMVSVSVRDTGPGIPEHVLGRIFDPFFTTKEPGVGTGLGLSISYGIIGKLGGNIQCRNTRGSGAEFIVTFPRVSQPIEPDSRDDHDPAERNHVFAGWAPPTNTTDVGWAPPTNTTEAGQT